MSTDSDYISVDDAARQVSVHPDSIRRLIREKKLPAVRIGGVYRIRKDAWELYLRTHSTIEDERHER